MEINICSVWFLGRQFKEASRFAGLIKTVGVEVNEEEMKLSEAEATMKVANEQLLTLGQELGVLHEQVSQLERKEGKVQSCYSVDVIWLLWLQQMKHVLCRCWQM